MPIHAVALKMTLHHRHLLVCLLHITGSRISLCFLWHVWLLLWCRTLYV